MLLSKYQFKTKGEDKCFGIQDVKLGLKYGMKMVTYWIIYFFSRGRGWYGLRNIKFGTLEIDFFIVNSS